MPWVSSALSKLFKRVASGAAKARVRNKAQHHDGGGPGAPQTAGAYERFRGWLVRRCYRSGQQLRVR
jgi:hypothetical protein